MLAQRRIEFDGAEKIAQLQGYRAESEYASAAAALAAAQADLVNAETQPRADQYLRCRTTAWYGRRKPILGQYVNPGTRLGRHLCHGLTRKSGCH